MPALMENKVENSYEMYGREDFSSEVIGAGIAVHKTLGSYHEVQVYVDALAHELKLKGFDVETNIEVPISYKGKNVGELEMHLLVDDQIAIYITQEVDSPNADDVRRMRDMLRGLERPMGLLLNFRTNRFTKRMKRVEVKL
jgi:GxxExxY protein